MKRTLLACVLAMLSVAVARAADRRPTVVYFMIDELGYYERPPEGFVAVFNGKDLTGWEGSPKYWSVEDGCLTGKADGTLDYNRFITWRGGTLKNFELRVQVKVSPGGNSGIQYRGTERPDLGESVVTGYQCDVVPDRADYNGMLYEERGRRILAHTSEKVIIDPQAQPWVVGEFSLKEFAAGEWHEFRVLVEGNHYRHWIDGHPTVDVIDLDEKGRKLEGVLAVQVHVGPKMTIQYRDFFLKKLPDDLPLVTPDQSPIPSTAQKVVPQGKDKPKRVNDDLSNEEKQAGFASMFNGRDFTGWRFTGDQAAEEVTNWKVADGVIHLSGGGQPHLSTEREYGDFEMRFQWRALKDKYNSGFFIRSGKNLGTNQLNLAQGSEGAFIGGKIEGAKAVGDLQKPVGEWNEWRVVVQGDKVAFWCNGKPAWEGTGLKPEKGYIGLQAEGAALEFRRLRIREIKTPVAADWQPVRIASGVSGHIHPAACVTKSGSVLIIFSQSDMKDLRLSRSADGGRTWSEPVPFAPTEELSIYPGALTTLGDGRVIHIWNTWYADANAKGGKSRYPQFSISSDEGRTWSEPRSLPKNPAAESVLRHPIVELGPREWLFSLMDKTVVYDPQTETVGSFADGRNHGLVPIVRTAKGTLVSGIGARSTDAGKTWHKVDPFPRIGADGWRYDLMAVDNGWLVASEVLGPGVGGDRWRFVVSRDDGQTWDFDGALDFYKPGRPIGGRACPKTVQLDKETLGTVYYDVDANQRGGPGVFFLRTPLTKLQP